MKAAGLSLTVAGAALWLRPDRTLFWPAEGVLAVADLHWGKVETFQRFGLGVPAGVLADDLARLGAAAAETGAREVWVLGDLVHGALGLTAGVVAEVASFLQALPAAVTLVAGNHDRHLQDAEGAVRLPAAWPVTVVAERRRGPFLFRHEPEAEPGAFVWAGHLHPAVYLRGRMRRDGVRLPCFAIGSEVGVLPAFSAFTGGGRVLDPAARCFAIAGDALVAVDPSGRPEGAGDAGRLVSGPA